MNNPQHQPVLSENFACKLLLSSDDVHLGSGQKVVGVVVVNFHVAYEDGVLHVLVHRDLVVVHYPVGGVRLATGVRSSSTSPARRLDVVHQFLLSLKSCVSIRLDLKPIELVRSDLKFSRLQVTHGVEDHVNSPEMSVIRKINHIKIV